MARRARAPSFIRAARLGYVVINATDVEALRAFAIEAFGLVKIAKGKGELFVRHSSTPSDNSLAAGVRRSARSCRPAQLGRRQRRAAVAGFCAARAFGNRSEIRAPPIVHVPRCA
jgi:hypothetical protein